MKVTIGKGGLKKTWQQDFPEKAECDCGGRADIAFVAHEGIDVGDMSSKKVCELYANEKNGMWLHDCCAVAVYFCRKCLKPTAKYNQG